MMEKSGMGVTPCGLPFGESVSQKLYTNVAKNPALASTEFPFDLAIASRLPVKAFVHQHADRSPPP